MAPNILFIMADQMAAPLLPLYDPASPIRMPHLQALASQGVVFDSAYCNSPLCAPSRFSMVSGQLPSKIGAFDNAADFPADVPTYAHYLRRLGYRTALSGKMHFCGPDQLHGYEERLTSDIYPADYGWAVNWDEPDVRPSWYHNMASVLQAGPCVRSNQLDFDEEVMFRARQYLFDHVRNTPEQPFCLTVSMTHPHDPYTIPDEFWQLYQDADVPLPRVQIPQAQQDLHSQRLLKVIDLWGKTMPDEAIRRGPYKFIYSSQDPALLFNLASDPDELDNLARHPAHQSLLKGFLDEVAQRWDLPALHQRVLVSQRQRRLVADALNRGRRTGWDHQPLVDAGQQYMRNHMDLDDLERRARFPRV
jgi:arylsulfatase A-like enzyme